MAANCKWGGANVSGQLASHTRTRPLLQGITDALSGRLPSARSPLVLGGWNRCLLIKSFTAGWWGWCLLLLPQWGPWVPKWFAIASQSWHRDTPPVMSFACIQSKCNRYWCDEMNKPFDIVARGFTVTATTEKVHADCEIRDMTIRCVKSSYISNFNYLWLCDNQSLLCFLVPARLVTHPPSHSNWSTFSSLLGQTTVCPSTPTPWSSSSSLSGRCSWAKHHQHPGMILICDNENMSDYICIQVSLPQPC